MTQHTVTAALALAAEGLHVFPQRLVREYDEWHKRPTSKHGSLDATVDPARIVELFRPRWVNLIGVRADRSGLAVLDIDPRHGGQDWLDDAFDAGLLPDTRVHQTVSRGWHLVYRAVAGVREFDVADGVECLVYQFTWWPAYSDAAVHNDMAIAQLPAFPIELLPAVKPRAVYLRPEQITSSQFVRGALWDAVDRVAAASQGRRNKTLYQQARRLMVHVAAGSLDPVELIEQLAEAAQEAGLEQRRIESSLRSAFSKLGIE